MTDLANDIAADEANTEAGSDPNISVTLKNGAGEVSIDTSRIPLPVYREALLQGLKVLAERAMSKITKAAYPDEAERKAAIRSKAEANIQDMYDGKTKITGQSAAKVKGKGPEMTEAMRLARNLVKDAMKVAKIKISTVKASEITAAAKVLLGQDPSILETARANLAARAQSPAKIDIKSLIKVDPELVAKAEAKAKAAKADRPLSAKQAGKAAPRAKARKTEATHHAGA